MTDEEEIEIDTEVKEHRPEIEKTPGTQADRGKVPPPPNIINPDINYN